MRGGTPHIIYDKYIVYVICNIYEYVLNGLEVPIDYPKGGCWSNYFWGDEIISNFTEQRTLNRMIKFQTMFTSGFCPWLVHPGERIRWWETGMDFSLVWSRWWWGHQQGGDGGPRHGGESEINCEIQFFSISLPLNIAVPVHCTMRWTKYFLKTSKIVQIFLYLHIKSI